MDSQTFWHVVALVGSVSGATWVLRKELSAIRAALSVHVAEDVAHFDELDKRVISLEKARRGKR